MDVPFELSEFKSLLSGGLFAGLKRKTSYMLSITTELHTPALESMVLIEKTDSKPKMQHTPLIHCTTGHCVRTRKEKQRPL